MKRLLKSLQLFFLLNLTCLPNVSAQHPANVAGRWDIDIQFVHGSGHYTAFFEQEGEKLSGTYRGQFIEGGLVGSIQGNHIEFRGDLRIEGSHLFYNYTGTVEGNTMSGTVNMGEYGEARWTARKH